MLNITHNNFFFFFKLCSFHVHFLFLWTTLQNNFWNLQYEKTKISNKKKKEIKGESISFLFSKSLSVSSKYFIPTNNSVDPSRSALSTVKALFYWPFYRWVAFFPITFWHTNLPISRNLLGLTNSHWHFIQNFTRIEILG